MDESTSLYLRPTWIGPSHFSVRPVEPQPGSAAHVRRDVDDQATSAGDDAE